MESTNNLKIKLKKTDAANFKTAIKKISDESKKAGFKRDGLTKDEIDCIQRLSDSVNS